MTRCSRRFDPCVLVGYVLYASASALALVSSWATFCVFTLTLSACFQASAAIEQESEERVLSDSALDRQRNPLAPLLRRQVRGLTLTRIGGVGVGGGGKEEEKKLDSQWCSLSFRGVMGTPKVRLFSDG